LAGQIDHHCRGPFIRTSRIRWCSLRKSQPHRTCPRDPTARRTRALHDAVPRKKRGQGMPGARCTRGLLCKRAQKGAHEHTGSAEAIRHSLRSGLNGFLRALPGDEFLLVTVAERISGVSAPGWADFASASLTSATDARTTRLRRTQRPQPKFSTDHVLSAELWRRR
jgi:hypothetical protein